MENQFWEVIQWLYIWKDIDIDLDIDTHMNINLDIYIYILDIDIKKGIFRKKQPPITFPNLSKFANVVPSTHEPTLL